MQDAAITALTLIATLDPGLVEVVWLSLQVSLGAVLLSCMIGLPLGALLAVYDFPGRRFLTVLTSAMMGLPPVVVGLTVYLMLSASGPLGPLQLLYTPTAMIIAQVILVTPIVAALSRQIIADMGREYDETLRTLGATRRDALLTLLFDARGALVTAGLAGMGRALAEVGAVMIVGGNINHVTRVMTTSIALETSRGELAMAMGLGLILLTLTLALNAGVMGLQSRMERAAHA